MSNYASLSDLLTWQSPLTYFFLVVLISVLFSVRYIMNASRILRESGGQMQFDLFKSSYSKLLKWTSLHQTKTGVITVMVVLAGIVWVVCSKV